MKNYTKPEIEFVLFTNSDVITTSGTGDDLVPVKLKEIVNNNQGMDYGAQAVTVFD